MAALVEGRKLKITLVSAENLPDVRIFGEMKVYAVVSLNGTTKISGADMDGGTNPRWNFVAGYTVGEAAVQLAGVNILVKLWCKRSLGDRLVGEVKIGVKNLFESSHNQILRYHVVGTSQGVLNISCSFGPKRAVSSPRPHTDTGRRSSSSGKKVLKMMTSLGLSLVDELLFDGVMLYDEDDDDDYDDHDDDDYDNDDDDDDYDDEDEVGGSC